MAKRSKRSRYSISVSGRLYERLRAAVPSGSVAGRVDEIIRATLDDPDVSAETVSRCWQGGSSLPDVASKGVAS